ncbi:hypothetical protein SAMN06298226_0163 [Nitrosovibrio sp. Nv4]|nr:hypothetical protein SAMN06298226_0163 [Nitrosovibrio sp. Nv4]
MVMQAASRTSAPRASLQQREAGKATRFAVSVVRHNPQGVFMQEPYRCGVAAHLSSAHVPGMQ